MSNVPSLIALIMAAAGAGAALSPVPRGNVWGGQIGASTTNVAPGAGNAARLVIERADDGFFYMPATINGASVRFLVDTGASMVILPRPLADQAGIAGTSSVMATTVGGPQSVELSSIRSLKAAGITLRNVPVAIQHSGMSIPLLGMDTLADMGRIEIDGNLLTVHPADNPRTIPPRN
jgi:aspartyl protease family protein